MSATGSGTVQPQSSFPKQAVVVIHGMGEQQPMDTITGFVRAVWETDPEITVNGLPSPAEVWSKPDQHTGSLELRRITTRQSATSASFPTGVRTDFYELYWADLSGGSTLSSLENWLFGLLFRNPFRTLPRKLVPAWLVLLLASLLVLYLALAGTVKPDFHIGGWRPYGWLGQLSPLAGPALAAFVAWLSNALLLPYFGRVVRYTRATPENIAARQAIRQRGLALLDALHDGTYERVIIVGHSLGSILAYDLLSYFWASRLASHTFVDPSPEFALLLAVEKARADYRVNRTPQTTDAFRDAQRHLCRALRRRSKAAPGTPAALDPRWLITDFITLGSPLTHSTFLLTSDLTSFDQRVDTRQYPVSPPVAELLDPNNVVRASHAGFVLAGRQPELMSFPLDGRRWQLHHAAPFAAVRWTNIYDPARFLFLGDIISGPLADRYGYAIVDVNLAELRGNAHRFTHTKYWELADDGAATPAVLQLRNALNLAGQRRPT
jgi:hypothetical protein